MRTRCASPSSFKRNGPCSLPASPRIHRCRARRSLVRGSVPMARNSLADPFGGLPDGTGGGRPKAASGRCATLPDVRVVIADDHRLVLDGIKRALEADGGFEIVGETQSGTQVLPLVGKANPDLVLLGGRMPPMDGLACRGTLPRRQHASRAAR